MGDALLLMSSFLLQNFSQIHTIPKKKSSLLNKFEKNLRITQDVRQIHGKTCGPVRRGARNRSLVNMHRNSPGITQCVADALSYNTSLDLVDGCYIIAY